MRDTFQTLRMVVYYVYEQNGPPHSNRGTHPVMHRLRLVAFKADDASILGHFVRHAQRGLVRCDFDRSLEPVRCMLY